MEDPLGNALLSVAWSLTTSPPRGRKSAFSTAFLAPASPASRATPKVNFVEHFSIFLQQWPIRGTDVRKTCVLSDRAQALAWLEWQKVYRGTSLKRRRPPPRTTAGP